MQTADFGDELAELNRRRLRVLAPLMAVLHVAHVIFFHVPLAKRAALSADVLRWRAGIVEAHAAMIPLALAVTWLTWRRRSSLPPWVAPVMAAAYIAHGAVCSGFDQIVVASLTPFVGYCLGIAVSVALTPGQAIGAYAIGAATMLTMLATLQRGSSARLADLPNVVSTSLIGVALAWMMHAGRRREFAGKLTIERQREELAALNAGLERRVQEQVAQLQAQVVARANELSLALQRMPVQRSDAYALPTGTLLGDRFEIEQLLGEGGMGAVYRGVDRSSGARVTIKVIRAASTQKLDALRRFIREAGAAATLTHPAVVRMIHVDVSDEGLLYQVQELVDGETLSRRLARKWPPGDAARLAAVLADALAAAHAHGVVHRDVKPDNVMLTTTAPGLKLLDFGIAKLYDAVSVAGEDDTTLGGLVLGTPAFMAPEQVVGGEVGDRADVYAVGLILFRLLAARGPFDASSPNGIMMRHVIVPAPDLRTVDAALPETLARLVARTLEKDPAQRPAAAELARALDGFADDAGAPPLAKIVPPSTGEVTVRARA
ncbi:MAG TPA: protein kinase [Polyangia bacterium]